MMNKKIIVAICGKSGSGKDTLIKNLCEHNSDWHKIVPCTTRPRRENEKDGINYYFLTKNEFAEKVLNGDMLEATYFNSWHYGVTFSSLEDGINIGAFDPDGFDILIQSPPDDVEVIGFYLVCHDKTRLLRSLTREENPDVKEIVRRFTSDEEDFIDFEQCVPDHNCILSNENENDLIQNVVYITNYTNNIWSKIDNNI